MYQQNCSFQKFICTVYVATKGTNKTDLNFLLFKYLLNNLILTVFVQIDQLKSEWLIVRKNAGTLLFSVLSEMAVQSLKLIVEAIFVLEFLKRSPPRKVYLPEFI